MARKKEKLTEDYLVSHGKEVFNGSVTQREGTIKDRWKKDNDLYDGIFTKNEKDKSDALIGQGRLFIPKTYSHVQRILVDVLDTYFFDREEIVDVASWKSIPSETKEIVKTLLNYRLNGHPVDFYQEAYEACLDALKNGAGIFKVYPVFTARKEIKTVEVQDPMTGEVIAVQQEVKTQDYEPIIECVPYEDVFFSPHATWKNYWQFPIVHRMMKTLDYLKRKGYKNLGLIKENTVDPNLNDEVKMQRSLDTGSPFTNNVNMPQGMNQVCVYEIWTQLDINNDGLLENVSYLMAGDATGPSIVLRDPEENNLPFGGKPPFILGMTFPESHKLYGKSLPQIVEGLQRETNALRNQRREAVALALRRPTLVNRSANIDLMALVNRKIGGVVLGDDVSAMSIREMDMQDPTQSTIQEQNRTDQDFYETTSIPPNLMGMPSQQGETATGVTSHVANANKKIAQIVRNLTYTLFIPAFKRLLQMEQEYCADEFIELVTTRRLGWAFASDGAPPHEVIQGEFELTIDLAMNKQAQINKYMMLMERATIANQSTAAALQSGVVNPADVHFVNVMTLFHKIMRVMGEKNVEEYMIQAQPPMMEEQPTGVASQPRLPADMDAQVTNMNPEAYA